jgi:hypothetical protein
MEEGADVLFRHPLNLTEVGWKDEMASKKWGHSTLEINNSEPLANSGLFASQTIKLDKMTAGFSRRFRK